MRREIVLKEAVLNSTTALCSSKPLPTLIISIKVERILSKNSTKPKIALLKEDNFRELT